MAFSSEVVQSVTLRIDADPGGNETFHLMRAPRAITVLNAYMVKELADGAGTAVKIQLENWGTAGTSVSGGTVVAAIGGTADPLGALTPEGLAATAAYDEIDAGEWLVANFIEEGAGFQSGDSIFYQVDYTYGVGA